MVAGFRLRIALGALLTAFRQSQGEGKTKNFTPEDSVPLPLSQARPAEGLRFAE